MDREKQKALQKPLTTSEIDFRIQSITKKGYAIILAYKDARADMHRLNSVLGVGNWQRKHERIDGKEFCSVGIWNEKIGQWCWVQDCGSESNTEAEKGQTSDSFKRACFNLGIGIELYDYPFICVTLNENEYEVDGNKAKPTRELRLKEWSWYSEFDAQNRISFLSAKDNKGVVRFKWGVRNQQTEAASTHTVEYQKPKPFHVQPNQPKPEPKAEPDSQSLKPMPEKIFKGVLFKYHQQISNGEKDIFWLASEAKKLNYSISASQEVEFNQLYKSV